MMSPASISPATVSTIRPVIAAGSISQALRGLLSLPTNSSTDAAPIAPSADQGRDAGGVDVVDDAFVPVAQQAANHVRSHPAQSHHSDLHVADPVCLRNRCRSLCHFGRGDISVSRRIAAKLGAYRWFHLLMTGSARSCS